MAEVQHGGNTNLLKRSLPDTEDVGLDVGPKSQRTTDAGVETDNSGDTAVAVQELDDIADNIAEICDHAEKEKARIVRESEEAVAQCMQQRAQILEQVPGFWGVALRNSLARDYITEDDDKLLEHLVSVDVASIESGSLQITLGFAEDNPYLESTEITRVVSHTDATLPAVAWKPGQELSPATDESGTGTFDSCNFFQRIACVTNFDTIDQIVQGVFWSPMKYYKGTADLAEERETYAFAEDLEDEYEQELEEDAVEEEVAVEEGLEQTLEQDPAAVQDEAGSSDEEAVSDGEDEEEELNIEDQEVEEEDDGDDVDADADADGDDGDAL